MKISSNDEFEGGMKKWSLMADITLEGGSRSVCWHCTSSKNRLI